MTAVGQSMPLIAHAATMIAVRIEYYSESSYLPSTDPVVYQISRLQLTADSPLLLHVGSEPLTVSHSPAPRP